MLLYSCMWINIILFMNCFYILYVEECYIDVGESDDCISTR